MIPLTIADEVQITLLDYLTTTFNLQDRKLDHALVDFLSQPEGKGMFQGPYVSLRLPFKKDKVSQAETPLDIAPSFYPYTHQAQAFARLTSKNGRMPQPTLITTGTGSGKTECFLYPVLDHCYRQRGERGIKAIILYPMNALAADQARRLAGMICRDDRLRGQVTAGLYVGGSGEIAHTVMGPETVIDDRKSLRDNPPDILLTNYKMLDFLLLRPEDKPLWRFNQPDSLRYLVLDELHTYDGAQGSDVACLIRRLRARLDIPEGVLCPVGTSATVLSLSGDTTRALTEFASQIFATQFPQESVIGEARETLHEFLPEESQFFNLPEHSASLRAQPGEAYETYLSRQMQAWFPGYRDLDPVSLVPLLRSHQFLHALLSVAGDSVHTLSQVCQMLTRWEPALTAHAPADQALIVQSFLALIAYGRIQDGSQLRPFLTVQSQLWVREMSRLMRQISAEPQFFWRDDIPVNQKPWGLPAYFCRECGHSGWLAVLREGDSHLTADTPTIYNHYFDRHKNSLYLYPPGAHNERLIEDRLCPSCLRLGSDKECPACQVETISVMLHRELSQPRGQRKQRDLQRCPICATDGSLSILGRQAASLLSVSISHLFTSPLNQENKLLAFTDSVQDASHRAAFFGARTYRFNLRSAFQTVLESLKEENGSGSSLPLDELADRLLRYWQIRWESESTPENRSKVGQKVAATFMPPDLQEMTQYRQYLDGPAQPLPPDLYRALRRRLSWEVAMEYGFNARVGRSLEKVGSSTAYIPNALWQSVLEKLELVLPGEFNLLRQLSPEAIHQFVAGLLERTRLRGGVLNDLLHTYIREQGSWFFLTKRQQPLLSPFGKRSPRFPRFLIDADSTVFDQFITRGSQATWFVDWARRTLSPDLGIADINEIYRLALQTLSEHNLLQSSSAKQATVYGVNPKALYLTAETAVLRCDTCGQSQTIAPETRPLWRGMSCLNFRCEGHYQEEAEPASELERSYYRALYARGQVARIYSYEHTGLLERGRREAIENDFKNQTRADAPNLLTATPTLEMGIDVGDLSATLACAIPPTTANYLQRIGRAGRATGNSFILALANAKPHDLTYFEQPLEMIAGSITPPGCYLDAPRMLQRQFLAFTMDSWAASDPQAVELPRNVKDMLSGLKREGFPTNLIGHYEQHKDQLIDRFLAMFGAVVSPPNQQLLRSFAAGDALQILIVASVADAEQERQRLRNTYRGLRREHTQIKESPAQYEKPEDQMAELAQEMRLISATIKVLEEKYILNFFTDAGLLPNYAFPETGVTLTAIITGIEAAEDEKRYLVKEYLRPAPLAIRELAPFNTFYAEGRKITINSLNLGGQDSVVERWQFCDRCAHMAPISASHYSTTCPQCGSDIWHDAGQQHNMIRLRDVTARTEHQQSLSSDDAEERQQEQYDTGLYFEVDTDDSEGAHLIPSLPFGIEALRQVTLREINYGFRGGFGHQMKIGGEEKPEAGFQVCPGCGVVSDSRQNEDQWEQVRHASTCSVGKGQKKGRTTPWHNLYLYREMTSEALRILLPVSTILVAEKLATFQACLTLGLRRKFQGDPDHIRIGPANEVSPDGTRRRYLMIYDTVPGGTSYLRDLAQPAVFRELLLLALDTLTSCTCRLDERKRACYRCLYAYHSQYERELISRQLGVEMLQEVLAHWPEMRAMATLSGTEMVSLVESELEQRFVDALQTDAQNHPDRQWQMKLYQGKEAWLLTVNKQQWLIEPQVTLGHWQGVAQTSRPDFVFWPQGALAKSVKPIAVFTDGFAFHVQPQLAYSRLSDDLLKRQALIESGKFKVWSVTWDDVEEFAAQSDYRQNLLSANQQAAFKGFVQKGGLATLETAVLGNAMDQLLLYLGLPIDEQWLKIAGMMALALLSPPRPSVGEAAVSQLSQRLLTSSQRPRLELAVNEPKGPYLYGIREANSLQLLVYVQQQALSTGALEALHLAFRLDDTQSMRAESGFSQDWRQFLLLLNIGQFLPNFSATTGENILLRSEENGAIREPSPVYGVKSGTASEAWQTVYDLTLPECHSLLSELKSKILPPEVGFALTDGDNKVLAEAELAWATEKTAVFLTEQEEDKQLFNKADWHTFYVGEKELILEKLLAS